MLIETVNGFHSFSVGIYIWEMIWKQVIYIYNVNIQF